jgi:Ca2+-transporting ATPase
VECLLERRSSSFDDGVMADEAFAHDADTVVTALWSGRDDGVSDEQAAARLARYGSNELVRDQVMPWWLLVFQQMREFVVLLLLVAAAIAFSLGEWIDGIAILLIVGLNAALGLYQHWKAEHALGALRQLSAPLAKVIRAGKLRKLDARELVPGDRIELEAGDHVPADARLLHSYSLQTLEAPLTGESTPIEKDATLTLPVETPIGDRRNMVFLGTVVAAGKASALVTATGMDTQLGRVADLLSKQSSPSTPLQMRMHQLGRGLVFICVALVAGIAALQLARGQTWLETLRLSVSLAVAAVPEGLPAALTITLALGAQRLARRQALVRRLSSVETLGSVNVICSDKTGTLTVNEMTVREIATADRDYSVRGNGYDPRGEIVPAPQSVHKAFQNGYAEAEEWRTTSSVFSRAGDDDVDLKELLTIGAWCNHAQLIPDPDGTDDWRIIGDPTEAALIVAARKVGIERNLQHLHVEFELPFDSDRKLMSVVVHTVTNGRRVFTKGAPENLLARCVAKQQNGQVRPLAEQDFAQIRRQAAEMAGRALRVIAIAHRELSDAIPVMGIEEELVFVGLVGMIDPPRPEAREAIQTCRAAGIRPVMITGDHPETARAIGCELGLFSEGTTAVTGAQLDEFTAQEFDRCAKYPRRKI